MSSIKHYTSEIGTQVLISLLKAHGIKKVIVSPGATNLAFTASIQQDSWFQLFSSVDERSAAYIACGMAAESNEPVVISCTGATASRNYLPGLTEAFYRKLPILAVTYNTGIHNRAHLIPQQIDRSQIQRDVSRLAIDIPLVKDKTDEWFVNVEINKAILALSQNGGGPVHINISTNYSLDYSIKQLPPQRVIDRVLPSDCFPSVSNFKRIAIFIGSHKKFTREETKLIDDFCHSHNSVVFCDHSSGYYGRFKMVSSLFGAQKGSLLMKEVDLLIHLGEITGDYYKTFSPQEVWRVNSDGEIKDTFHCLRYIFQMEESEFFRSFSNKHNSADSFLLECQKEYNSILTLIPELPFSNIWIAQNTSSRIPKNSIIHFSILNSLRSWNFFRLPNGVESYSNVGGFGIDGIVSTILGASLVYTEKLYYCIVGDLAFFYDLNSLGNRHVGSNLRILLINNGKGTEFTNYSHAASQFGEDTNPFMAAAGHYGNKSPHLVKHFAEDLGFEYLTASNKEEYLRVVERFLTPEITDKPMIFEVFTDSKDESDALEIMLNLKPDSTSESNLKASIKKGMKSVLGDKGVKIINIIRE